MPTREQLQKVFTSLVENSLDFFERSASELETDQKFSIVHFATGLELLLKARLFHEHWTLIAVKPHCCTWTSVNDGTVRTLPASDICSVITTTTGLSLRGEKSAFESIFKHRNHVLHWAPHNDLKATVAEQCLAWHYLHALLVDQWSDIFDGFGLRIGQVEVELRKHNVHLDKKFQIIQPELRARLLCRCPACGFEAGVVKEGTRRVLSFQCHVCGYTGLVARWSCGALLPWDSFPGDCPRCGKVHDRTQLLDELDAMPLLSAKEILNHVPDRGYCGECFDYDTTVAPDGDGYVCVACGVRFEPGDRATCEWCNETWFGWDISQAVTSVMVEIWTAIN